MGKIAGTSTPVTYNLALASIPALSASAILGIVGAAITAVYMLRLISRVFYGPPSSLLSQSMKVSINERIGALILAAFIIFIGLVPFPFIRVIDVGVSELLSGLGG